ncbi:MAG: hypothetical protein Q8O15_09820 [Rectinemataceae bacterium]|nr:hypothetical protein [Rectinemataceae bacterium]
MLVKSSARSIARNAAEMFRFLIPAALALVAVSGISAEQASAASVPDSLILEVVVAPGYDWMAECMKAAGAGVNDGAGVIDVNVPAELASSEPGSAGHLGHHPAAAPAPRSFFDASTLDAATLGAAIADLKRLIGTLQKPESLTAAPLR